MDPLRKLGLSENEIAIYHALLELGKAKAHDAAKSTRKNRTLVYDVLRALQRKGLVGYSVEGGKRFYFPASPEKLGDIIREEKVRLNELEKEIRIEIPNLKQLLKKKYDEMAVEIYTGSEGYKTLMEDLLREGKDYYVIGYSGEMREHETPYEIQWHRRRAKLKLHRWLITSLKTKGRRDLKYSYTHCKFFPQDYEASTYVVVYGEKTVIFLPLTRFAGILIKSKRIARAFKLQFDLIWKSL